MELDGETNKEIEELQILQGQLQNVFMQKQAIQIETNEIENAIEELKKTKEEAYKIISGIMIKTEPKILLKELENKKKILDMKLKSVEKQEQILESRTRDLKEKIDAFVSKKIKKQ